jgi:hypothetical protein
MSIHADAGSFSPGMDNSPQQNALELSFHLHGIDRFPSCTM